LRNTFESL